MTLDAIVLVYASGSTLRALSVDVARKVLGVAGCTLCAITHGVTGERRAWKNGLAALGVPVETWHEDDAPRELRAATGERWPAVLARAAGEVIVLLDAEAIARCGTDPDALVGAIRAAIAARGLTPSEPSRAPRADAVEPR